MRKVILILLIIFLFSGCTNNSEIRNADSSVQSYITVDKTDMTLVSQDQEEECYQDENGDEYSFDKNTDSCIGYSKNSSNLYTSGDIKGEEECRQIAEQFLNERLDLSEYTFFDQKLFGGNNYSIDYTKTIQGYPTMDCVYVIMKTNGIITDYRMLNSGMFDNVEVPKINESEIERKIIQNIKEEYGDKLEECEILIKALQYEDDIISMVYEAEIKSSEGYSELTDGAVPIK